MSLVGLLFAIAGPAGSPLWAQAKAEARNMVLVGHTDLNGNGDGGEGLVIQQWPDGRRVLSRHAIVDENGLIYANDRFTGGLYILRYTGQVPLN